ncbi:sugar phosphate isomerase/epimerase family protein [Paenibacillus solisilvae]|uniref:Sugar phosphate isomerase/epimerase family protein n=1 Tax=Paenibacillus solisilvae TaxID=2486751 RepID=A0ABW0W1C9_9BACL
MILSTITDMLFIDSFEEALRTTKELGFDYIDVRDKLDGDTVDSISVEKARELKIRIDHYGLKTCVIVSRMVNPVAMTGPNKYDKYDDKHPAHTLDVINNLCDVADALDAKYIRGNPLYRPVNYHLLSAQEQEEQQKHNAAVMFGMGELAKSRDKIILIENEPPSLANKAEELGWLMRLTNHPNIRINWDIVNEWRAGIYPTLESYEYLKGLLGGTHLKGAYRVYGSQSADNPSGLYRNFGIPDQDDFDHEPLLKAIAQYDPQAVMSIDTHFHHLDEEDQKIGPVEVMRRSKVLFERMLT